MLENSKEARNYVEILKYHNHQVAILQILNKLPLYLKILETLYIKNLLNFMMKIWKI